MNSDKKLAKTVCVGLEPTYIKDYRAFLAIFPEGNLRCLGRKFYSGNETNETLLWVFVSCLIYPILFDNHYYICYTLYIKIKLFINSLNNLFTRDSHSYKPLIYSASYSYDYHCDGPLASAL